MTKEKDKITSKKRYERLKAAGLCVVCGKNPAVTGIVRCETCRNKTAEYQKLNNASYVKAGICMLCHKENVVEGLKICEKCREKNKNNFKKYIETASNDKIKRRQKRNNEKSKLLYKKRKELGLCVFCGKSAIPGQVLCMDCRMYNNQRRFGYLEQEERRMKNKSKR